MTDHWYNFNKAREALVAQMKKCSLDTGLSDRFPFGMVPPPFFNVIRIFVIFFTG